jgi:hypothetical protein
LQVPAGARCFPEYDALIVSPCTLVVVSAQRSGTDQLAVEHDVRPASFGNLLQRFVQVGRLLGQDLHALVPVEVRGRPRYPEPGAHDLDIALGAQPPPAGPA